MANTLIQDCLDRCAVRRVVTAEIMDSPDVEPVAHGEALDGLKRINDVSRTADRMLQPILEMARREGLNHLSLLTWRAGEGMCRSIWPWPRGLLGWRSI